MKELKTLVITINNILALLFHIYIYMFGFGLGGFEDLGFCFVLLCFF